MNKELENTIKRLEEEVNKQAKIIQWYEKENRHNQETIIDLSKRIDITTQAIDKLHCWGEVLDPEFQQEMLKILEGDNDEKRKDKND
nr:MAG TPA: hypothetical protein [Bacteriophage sp.]